MTTPEPRIVDLRTEVPSDWSLTGLSAPRSDGANFFRTPTASQSVLTFATPEEQFVQYRYQLFSPNTPVTGRVLLNGRYLDTFTFPAGKFVNREVSGFTQVGANTLTVEYRCGEGDCRTVPINQYWTQLALAPAGTARREVGLGVERWTLDAPGSPLTVKETGPLLFDNANYFRFIQGDGFTLSWPLGTRVLDASFQVSANDPFRVTVGVDGQVVFQKRGDESSSVAPTISLVEHPAADSLQVQVDCLTGQPGCARLYFARASVYPPEIRTAQVQVPEGLTVVLTFMVLAGLLWWLQLPPFGPRPSR